MIGKYYNIFVQLFMTVCDMPARCALYNVKYYNGAFGCGECVHPGYTIDKANKMRLTMPYLPQLNFQLKTPEFYIEKWSQLEHDKSLKDICGKF